MILSANIHAVKYTYRRYDWLIFFRTHTVDCSVTIYSLSSRMVYHIHMDFIPSWFLRLHSANNITHFRWHRRRLMKTI